MKKKMLLILLAVALGVATIAAATMAWFTDEDTAGDATFTAGILDIDVSDGLNELLDVATIDHMNPGDEFGPISIDIVNQGTKKLAWFGDWEFTYVDQLDHEDGDKLLDALYIKEMKMEMLDAEGNLWTDDPWYQGDSFIVDGRGALYNYNQGQADHYNGLANLSGFNVITLRNFNDNKDMITLPGSTWEHMGALRPGNKYRLTVTFGFHELANNDYQGDRNGVSPIKVGFKVNATQIKADAVNGLMDGLGTSGIIDWLNAQIDIQPDNSITPR